MKEIILIQTIICKISVEVYNAWLNLHCNNLKHAYHAAKVSWSCLKEP